MWDFKTHYELPNYQRLYTQPPAHQSWKKAQHASRGLRGIEHFFIRSFRYFYLWEGELNTSVQEFLSLASRQWLNKGREKGGDTQHDGSEVSSSKQKAACPLVISASFQNSHGSHIPILQSEGFLGKLEVAASRQESRIHTTASLKTTDKFTKQRSHLPSIARQLGWLSHEGLGRWAEYLSGVN